jgi:o-succinylbenzoate---CoA ligase
MHDSRLSVFSAAREAPRRDALVWHAETLSYEALADRVAASMRGLSARGVSRGARVAVRAENHLDAVVTLLALMELDATAVLLHPRLTETETRVLVADAAPSLTLDANDLASPPPSDAPLTPSDHAPDATLAMLYTSGTTGRPRGAMLSRRAFLASADASAANLGWRDDDRWLLCLPVCHVGGFSVLTRCLVARRCVVLRPRFDADDVLATITRDDATLLSVVPTMLRALLDRDAANALSRLRAVLVGGAATPHALLERCVDRRVRALTTYGLTEACSQVTTQRYDADAPFTAHNHSGAPLRGVEVELVGDDGEVVPPGAIGRIRVRGASVMMGYWGHPPLDGAWLDTGDLGSFDTERNLTLHARRTDLIVTGGENVYPVEIEHALLEMPGVASAMVFGVPDERWGQVVAAAIVRDRTIDDADGWLDATMTALSARVAAHKRPRRVCVVDALPMRATGKVDRAEGVRSFSPKLAPWPR